MSSGEPVAAFLVDESEVDVVLTAPWQHLGAISPSSFGFVKGQARITTLMAIICMAMDANFAFEDARSKAEREVRLSEVLCDLTSGITA